MKQRISPAPTPASAQPSVQECARILADKMNDPFSHPDMNAGDIDWQSAWNAFWVDADERDAPAAIISALRIIAGETKP